MVEIYTFMAISTPFRQEPHTHFLDSAEGLLSLGHVQPSFLSFNCCEAPPRFEQLFLRHPGLGREVKLCDALH